MPFKPVFRSAVFFLLLILSLPFGTLWHELVGHGLTGVLFGGRISYVEVLGLSLWPEFSWVGFVGYYGRCNVEGITNPAGQQLYLLMGSMSTWLVSVLAIILLWVRVWHGLKRLVLVCLGLWWIDLFTYTLPSWGLKRSVFWGGDYSEPFEAAVALGMPGPLFQTFVLVSCVLLAGALIGSCRRRAVGRPIVSTVQAP